MKNLFAFSYLILTLLFPNSLFAGNFHDHFKQANPEVKQYVKEHILPVLKEKRLVVEKELSTAEKDELASYRVQLKQLNEQHKEQAQQKPADVSFRDYRQSEEQKVVAKQWHQQIKAIMQKVQVIANNHLVTLDNIHQQLEPSHIQWMADLAKLKTNNGSHDHYGKKPLMDPSLFNGHNAYARFLLMPVQVSSSTTGDLGELQSFITDEPSSGGVITSFQVLPNPASNELVTGNEQIPGENEFKLMDMQGKVVLALQNIYAAQHIDVSRVPNGMYLARLNYNGQSIDNKIVISH